MDALPSPHCMSNRSARFPASAAMLLALALSGGCHRPWYAHDDAANDPHLTSHEAAPVRTASGVKSAVVDSKDAGEQTAQSTADPFDRAGEQDAGEQDAPPTMAQIAAELQGVQDIDPAAREQFLADLRDIDPEYWPQMVKTFRATLAYRREHSPASDHVEDKSVEHATTSASDTSTAPAAHEANKENALRQSADDHRGTRPLPEPEPVEWASDVRTESVSARKQILSAPRQSPPQDDGVVNAIFVPQVIAGPQQGAGGPIIEAPQAPATADTWQSLLDRAIAQLESETAAAPATSSEITEHARLRLLYLAGGDYDAALRPIDGAPPNHQDFWAKLFFAVATYFDDQAQPDLRRRASLTRHHLAAATDLVGEIATLDVRNLTFCTEIRGFGIYEPLDAPEFRAGEQVKLYAEVANYKSDHTPEGFRTLLATSYEILDASGQRVDSGEFPQVEDACRSRRQDFHIQYGVNLPARIYPGTYRLELTIEDMLSRKLGRASVAFEIEGESGTRK